MDSDKITRFDIFTLRFTKWFLIAAIGVFFVNLSILESVDTAICLFLILMFSGLVKEVNSKLSQIDEAQE